MNLFMKNDIKLSFTDTKKLTKVYPVNKKNIFKPPENYHIFFCDGLILTKKIKNKFKITFFNKKIHYLTILIKQSILENLKINIFLFITFLLEKKQKQV